MPGRRCYLALSGQPEPAFPLVGRWLLVGSAAEANIRLSAAGVLPRHATFEYRDGGWTLRVDTDGAGCHVDGRRLVPGEQVRLTHGMLLEFGTAALQYLEEDLGCSQSDSTELQVTSDGAAITVVRPQPQVEQPDVFIGRSGSCDVHLPHPTVSQSHARLTRTPENRWVLTDLGSRYGTYVNGERTRSAELRPGDVVGIGLAKLVFDGRQLTLYDESRHIRIDGTDLTRDVVGSNGERLRILDHVGLTVLPREFVAIVGGSGAGKSTLLRALLGLDALTQGRVYVNGSDYREVADQYRAVIGYVPQDDIVHPELTITEALTYAAELRLPVDNTDDDIRERVGQVTHDLRLEERADTPIHALSGGQRKRVSVATEMLSQPGIIFLDEPTSGLDPGLEREFMQLMAAMARRGHTVLLVTHATQSITECDLVAFMAPGGRLAFFGPPSEALEFFGADDFGAIYPLLTRETASYWCEAYHRSPQHTRYVVERRDELDKALAGRTEGRPAAGAAHDRAHPPGWLQFLSLTGRYLRVMSSDARNLAFLLAQAPTIALIVSLVLWHGDIFTGITGSAHAISAPTAVFLLCIICLWLGCSNSAQEIVKERSVYQRERMVALGIGPYLASKVCVLGALCALQALALLSIMQWRILHADGLTVLKLLGVLVVTSWGGMLVGLALSASAASTSQATTWVPLFLIPQIVLSGALVALDAGPRLTEWISYAAISRWSFSAAGSLLRINDIYPGHFSESLFDTPRSTCWMAMGAIMAFFAALTPILLWSTERSRR